MKRRRRNPVRFRPIRWECLEQRALLAVWVADDQFAGDGALNHDITSGDEFSFSGATQQYSTGGENVRRLLIAGRTSAGTFGEDMVVSAYGPDGTYDTSFGVGGVTYLDFGASAGEGATALGVDEDGSIVVAGYTTRAGQLTIAIARLTANGIPDPAFDVDGRVVLDPLPFEDMATAVLMLPGTKFIVVGYAGHSWANGSPGRIVLAQYDRLPGGEWGLDPTFGVNGLSLSDLRDPGEVGGNIYRVASPQAALLGPNGEIYLGGNTVRGFETFNRVSDAFVARFTPEGELDPTYGADGRFIVGYYSSVFNGPSSEVYHGLALAPDGDVVAVGSVWDRNTLQIPTASRFDNATKSRFDYPMYWFGSQVETIASGAAFDSDGRLLVGGSWNAQGNGSFFLAGFTAAGNQDLSFGPAVSPGRIYTDPQPSYNGLVYSSEIVFESDAADRLTIVGYGQQPAGQHPGGEWQINAVSFTAPQPTFTDLHWEYETGNRITPGDEVLIGTRVYLVAEGAGGDPAWTGDARIYENEDLSADEYIGDERGGVVRMEKVPGEDRWRGLWTVRPMIDTGFGPEGLNDFYFRFVGADSPEIHAAQRAFSDLHWTDADGNLLDGATVPVGSTVYVSATGVAHPSWEDEATIFEDDIFEDDGAGYVRLKHIVGGRWAAPWIVPSALDDEDFLDFYFELEAIASPSISAAAILLSDLRWEDAAGNRIPPGAVIPNHTEIFIAAFGPINDSAAVRVSIFEGLNSGASDPADRFLQSVPLAHLGDGRWRAEWQAVWTSNFDFSVDGLPDYYAALPTISPAPEIRTSILHVVQANAWHLETKTPAFVQLTSESSQQLFNSIDSGSVPNGVTAAQIAVEVELSPSAALQYSQPVSLYLESPSGTWKRRIGDIDPTLATSTLSAVFSEFEIYRDDPEVEPLNDADIVGDWKITAVGLTDEIYFGSSQAVMLRSTRMLITYYSRLITTGFDPNQRAEQPYTAPMREQGFLGDPLRLGLAPQQLRHELEIESSTQNLVVFAHGWNPGNADPPLPAEYENLHGLGGNLNYNYAAPDGIGERYFLDLISRTVDFAEQYTTDWQVGLYDWSNDAATGSNDSEDVTATSAANPLGARDAGTAHGAYLARRILAVNNPQSLEAVQLVGHSAGSWVVTVAAQYLRDAGFLGEIHVTVLDAFVPTWSVTAPSAVDTNWIFDELGEQVRTSNAALENYYSYDTEFVLDGSDQLGWTSGDYDAWNVNLRLDEGWIFGADAPGFESGFDTHSGPLGWYAKTIAMSQIPAQLATLYTELNEPIGFPASPLFRARNVAPTISAAADQSTRVGQSPVQVAFSVSDLETAAQDLLVTVTSDNPLLFPPTALTLGGGGTTRSLTLSPAGSQIGSANITLTVSDGDGRTAIEVFAITVRPSTQHVASTSVAAGGVQMTLSDAAIATGVLNLFSSSALGPADVQFVGTSGLPIAGSLVIAPGEVEFTFVPTAPLPPDTYTLTLRSAANGFQTVAGDLLDGDGDGVPGGNFVTTFTVTVPPVNAITVSLPHFARGPEQAVNVPASSSLGLPIQVSDGAGLTALSFELAFDTGLLSVTNVALVDGGTATLSPLPSGRVLVELAFAAPLGAGPQTVAYLTATVPPSAASRYGERGVLDISALNLNAGAVPGIDQDAVHVNAYFGDLGRNGRYDSFDVQQASRMAVRLDTGFQQHPLLDPTILADFNGNGRIDSFDVQQLSRLALRLPVTSVPALPSPAPTTTDTDRLSEEETEKPKPSATPALRSDIDGNGAVDAQDVLWAIYYYNRSPNGELPSDAQAHKLDLNNDQQFDPADVLLAITDLNAEQAGEGESLAELLAADLISARKRK